MRLLPKRKKMVKEQHIEGFDGADNLDFCILPLLSPEPIDAPNGSM